MYQLSAKAIRDLFKKREISAVAIAEATLKRIGQHDPKIGAFLSIFSERLLQKAKQLDQKKTTGKLAGIPIAIKDNILIEGQINTCGSKFLSNYKAVYDATVVRLLEQEDALLIGKTNLDEFAMGSSTENSAYQLTKNPWDLACTAGGSSGGSAAAVAARLCPLALGSDTGGSVRQPASFTGLVGFKPTYGRVSRYGLVAFGSSLDQIGPFSTTVADAALVMEVIGQHCPCDSTSLNLPPEPYLKKLTGSIKGGKLGVPWSFLKDLSKEAQDAFRTALDKFKQLGVEIVEVDLDILNYSIAVYYILGTAEAASNLARFDGIRYGNRSPRASSLDEVYRYSRQEGFGPEVKRRILLGTYVLSAGYQDAYYKKAKKVRALIMKQYEKAFQSCDLIAMPTCPGTAFELGKIQDPLQMYWQDIYTVGANLAGLPAVTIPSGFSKDNKPFGFQLTGPLLHDATVLQYAHQFEQQTPFHKMVPPLFNDESL